MMWKEFEEIAGYEVSYETYTKVIEPMYMAIPESISKQEFVKMLNKKAFALPSKSELIRQMKKIAQFIFENCGLRSFYEEEAELREIAQKYAERVYGINCARDEEGFIYFNTMYAYCGHLMERGCCFQDELVIVGRNYKEIARIQLVKR